MGKQLGRLRAVFLVSICCVGSFLFAYDTGIIGGILTLDSFMHSFRYGEDTRADINSNSNSLLQAGGMRSFIYICLLLADLLQPSSRASSSGRLPSDSVADGLLP